MKEILQSDFFDMFPNIRQHLNQLEIIAPQSTSTWDTFNQDQKVAITKNIVDIALNMMQEVTL